MTDLGFDLPGILKFERKFLDLFVYKKNTVFVSIGWEG
jgi:hypothetical protein